tara:strand:- start:614 stop:745 length:132 start_codon:yes stop_codon:yes gene_type:complete
LPKIKTPGADLWDSIDHTRDRTEDSIEDDGYPHQAASYQKIKV